MSNKEPTTHQRHWPNGQVKEEWSEVDGLKEGWRRFYLESGLMFSEMEFHNGVGNGVIREWHEDGSKRLEGTIKEGEFHGTFSLWWPNGVLMEGGVYDNGKHTKGYRYFTDAGELWKEVQHDEGEGSHLPPFSASDT